VNFTIWVPLEKIKTIELITIKRHLKCSWPDADPPLAPQDPPALDWGRLSPKKGNICPRVASAPTNPFQNMIIFYLLSDTYNHYIDWREDCLYVFQKIV
jgi:hypothetical protein